MIRVIIPTLLSLLLFSCTSTIHHFEEYEKQFLPKSAIMPSKEKLKGQPPKVAVFALEENKNETATQAGLGKSIADTIENTLSENRLAELVDRDASKKLQEEIALAEMKKTGSYKGPIVADYAISGTISNAGFTSKYSSGFVYLNAQKQLVTVPPHYTYKANVAGNLKIYELPSLQVIEAIEFEAKEGRSENVRQNGGFSLGALQIGGKKVDNVKRDDHLVRKAGKEAIINIAVDIKNFFAKKGYILEKRVRGKTAIFKVSIGSEDGIKKGDKFDIIAKYETQNPITEELEIERRVIAKGVISDKINPKSSWVIIRNKKAVNKIRLGDMVKVKYKKNQFRTFIRTLKNYAI